MSIHRPDPGRLPLSDRDREDFSREYQEEARRQQEERGNWNREHPPISNFPQDKQDRDDRPTP